MRIYTRTGDAGTTALLHGGRVPKDAPVIAALGAIDEAQAFIGAARAEAEEDRGLDTVLVAVERDLWVVMAEVAAGRGGRDRLRPGETLCTPEMVTRLEAEIDAVTARCELPGEFVVPGQNRLSASLDVARVIVRRAELAVLAVDLEGSSVLPYLNRLSDLLWALARATESQALPAREHGHRSESAPPARSA